MLSILLVLAAALTSSTAVFAAEGKTDLQSYEFGAPEKLTQPIKATTLLNSTTSVEDGNAIICTTASGDPAKFNVFDLQTGTLLRSFDIPGAGGIWAHTTDPKGNVYFAGFSGVYLYRYSPETKQLENLGKIASESAVPQMTTDEEGNVYMSTYPKAKIVKWDVKTKQMMDWGTQLPGEKYVRGIAYHDGFIYAGGATPGTKFFKIDVKTLKKTILDAPKTNSAIESYYACTVAGDKIFVWVNLEATGTEFAVFDTKTQKWEDTLYPEAHGPYATPEIDGYAYMSTKKGMIQYELATGKAENMGWNYGTGFRGGGVVEIHNDPDFPGKTFANVSYSGGVGLINFTTGKRKSYENKMDATGTRLVGLKTLENGNVMYSGIMGPKAAELNPDTLEVVSSFSMAQSTAIAEIDGKVYFGHYPKAAMSEYDPSKPIDKQNPRQLFETNSQGQSRPMKIVDCGDKIAMSTIADYNMREGAVTLYDKKTGKVDCYKNIIKDQSVTGLAYKDGILYASTTVFGGLGPNQATETSAKIFKMDVATGKLLQAVVPKFKTVTGDMRMAGDLVFGPDGLLWSTSDGLIFAMDPQTLEVKKEKDVKGFNWNRYPGGRWDPYAMKFDDNGMLYCAPRSKVVVLDPETMETIDVPMDGVETSRFDLGNDGYLYYYVSNNAYRMKIPSNVKSDSNVVLMLNSKKTLVKGTETSLDVPATTVNDRTVVPVRFISESFDAKVDWEEAAQKVTITKGDTVITVVLGESKLMKNGQEIKLDTPAFTQNDRTLLPLRAVAEALDKQVFWKELGDSGLIVIGETMLEEPRDKNLIEGYINALQ